MSLKEKNDCKSLAEIKWEIAKLRWEILKLRYGKGGKVSEPARSEKQYYKILTNSSEG